MTTLFKFRAYGGILQGGGSWAESPYLSIWVTVRLYSKSEHMEAWSGGGGKSVAPPPCLACHLGRGVARVNI